MITNNTNNFRTILRRLFYVPKCASCGQRINPIVKRTEFNHGLPCFCDRCLPLFHRSTSEMCHNCGKIAGDCTCMPLKNTFTQPTIPSLFFYHPDSKSIPAKAIYTLKRKKYTDLCDFLCEELSVKVEKLLDELELRADDCIFTYIPRTNKALRKHGFDQSELLAKRLCSKVGGACAIPLLTRKRGKAQKKLSKGKRAQNVNSSIFTNNSMRGIDKKLRKGSLCELLSGKTVILIDDIITTGASFQRGIVLLKGEGAKNVIIACIARCEIKKKIRKGE